MANVDESNSHRLDSVAANAAAVPWLHASRINCRTYRLSNAEHSLIARTYQVQTRTQQNRVITEKEKSGHRFVVSGNSLPLR
jgi:hypothetical protein